MKQVTTDEIAKELDSGLVAERGCKMISELIADDHPIEARNLIEAFNFLFNPFYIGIDGKIYRY